MAAHRRPARRPATRRQSERASDKKTEVKASAAMHKQEGSAHLLGLFTLLSASKRARQAGRQHLSGRLKQFGFSASESKEYLLYGAARSQKQLGIRSKAHVLSSDFSHPNQIKGSVGPLRDGRISEIMSPTIVLVGTVQFKLVIKQLISVEKGIAATLNIRYRVLFCTRFRRNTDL